MPAERKQLNRRDRSVLDFEGSWWLYPGPKDRAVRDHLDMSSTRYHQALRRLMDSEEALLYAPLTVRRLRKMRQQRLDQINERLHGGDSHG